MLLRAFPSLGRAVPRTLAATRSCRSASGLAPAARGAAALLNTKVPPLDKSRWAPPPLRVLVGGSMPVVVISSISSEAECAANKKQKKQHTKSTAALLLLLQGARAHLRDGGVLRRLGLVGVRERLPSQRSAHGEVSRARPERGWACDAAVGGRAQGANQGRESCASRGACRGNRTRLFGLSTQSRP